MATRITRGHVEAKLATVNRMLGIEKPGPFAPGSVDLGGAYGGWRVEQVTSKDHSIRVLSTSGYATMRDCDTFVDGMIAALRIAQGD